MTFVIYKFPQCQFDGRDVCGVPLIWNGCLFAIFELAPKYSFSSSFCSGMVSVIIL